MFLKLCLYHEFVEEFMQGKEKVNEKKKGKKKINVVKMLKLSIGFPVVFLFFGKFLHKS